MKYGAEIANCISERIYILVIFEYMKNTNILVIRVQAEHYNEIRRNICRLAFTTLTNVNVNLPVLTK